MPAFEALGAGVDQVNINLDTPLHFASGAGSLALVALLLRAGADAGLQNSAGITPLMAASAAGSHLAIEMMMRQALAQDSSALPEGGESADFYTLRPPSVGLTRR
jgi:ankyrin repeat protein